MGILRKVKVKDSRNIGFLNLVHPGGFAEIHQNPVTAEEIMKKNPRHCVTRPDVFKFPWIVVKPESVLKPGCVFYIVPFHTIYRLLKKNKQYRYQEHPPDPINSSIEVMYFDQLMMMKSLDHIQQARAKVDYKFEDWPYDSIFPESLPDTCQEKEFSFGHKSFADYLNEEEEEEEEEEEDYKNDQEVLRLDQVISFVEPRSSSSSGNASNASWVSNITSPTDCGLDAKTKIFEEKKPLKSCLKKSNEPRLDGLRVKFSPTVGNLKVSTFSV